MTAESAPCLYSVRSVCWSCCSWWWWWCDADEWEDETPRSCFESFLSPPSFVPENKLSSFDRRLDERVCLSSRLVEHAAFSVLAFCLRGQVFKTNGLFDVNDSSPTDVIWSELPFVCWQDGSWTWRRERWRRKDSSPPWGCAWAPGAPSSVAWGVCVCVCVLSKPVCVCFWLLLCFYPNLTSDGFVEFELVNIPVLVWLIKMIGVLYLFGPLICKTKRFYLQTRTDQNLEYKQKDQSHPDWLWWRGISRKQRLLHNQFKVPCSSYKVLSAFYS